MHKKLLVALGISGIFVTFVGCTTTPPTTFPQTANPEITTTEDYDILASTVNELLDKRIKIAGKSIRTKEIDEGLMVFAEWLPYPSDDLHFSDPPQTLTASSKSVKKRRFSFLYPGAKNVDPTLTWQGNKFILIGDIKGQKKITITLTGKMASVPHLVASCVRVWKTGG
ncbi:MAG: hypothetical protein R3351_03905, partial [Nitrospirales bacterium]|nr:hypothetical protein [Nitrospirales bacterium]